MGSCRHIYRLLIQLRKSNWRQEIQFWIDCTRKELLSSVASLKLNKRASSTTYVTSISFERGSIKSSCILLCLKLKVLLALMILPKLYLLLRSSLELQQNGGSQELVPILSQRLGRRSKIQFIKSLFHFAPP